MSSVSNHCTPGHCIWPPAQPAKFEILSDDSEGMQEAKRLWNSSSHECHSNYMGLLEKRKISKIHYKELEKLKQIWGDKGKDDPELFFIYHKTNQENEQKSKVIRQDSTEDRTSNWFYIKKVLVVIAVASFAIFFFITVIPEISVITTPLACLLAGAALYEIYADYRGVIVLSRFL